MKKAASFTAILVSVAAATARSPYTQFRLILTTILVFANEGETCSKLQCLWKIARTKTLFCLAQKAPSVLSTTTCHSPSRLRGHVHPGLRRVNYGHTTFPVSLEAVIVTFMHSHPHKHCPSVENKIQVFLPLRKPVGNNSILFAFSVSSKRTDRHLELNAVSVGLLITSTACCQKLVLVVGKHFVGL